ncbi:MAG: hypothetical protein MR332_13870 [Fusicatenibacter sp.]|nr:hypothetical protein [Fusicatenibacter sp.]
MEECSMGIAGKFTKLKTSIGGNREKTGFEYTFGMPKEEQEHITRPNRANTRIMSELEFALHLSESEAGKYDEVLERTLDFLLERIEEQGVLRNCDCEEAEKMMSSMEAAAKSYQLILAAHAHIDMNWMWSFDETVAVVLATFRSILNIMDQYPEFCFSQSQGAVYQIVEEYDPEMMEEIRKRISEGRWEVTATAWVETDKNMPTGESLLRHIKYTKEYMRNVWGVDQLEVDFSPDTFGHSAYVPEIDQFGEVKYYYHCRGNAREEILYRYRAPSGCEVLAYREPNWYNGAVTPQMGAGLPEISRRCQGLRTGLVVYGVGDHGGGPTRRDVERALEMMTWKIYPQIRFGTFHEYFKEAEAVWDKLPIVDQELNYFAPGCYTTQSRIKRGNRRLEASLLDAEAMTALAGKLTGFSYAKEKMEKAWRDVLFTHFHDILTGSCVQDSREYAMGLFQRSFATTNTQIQNAMRSISQKIDTSPIPVDIDAYNSQSEGAGAGYGVENFIGVPSTERGSGRTRIFHIFNTLSRKRSEVTELTVWDWMGDLRRLELHDFHGNEIPFQLLDHTLQHYWDHKYVRVLADVTVPALGYTTVVLSEKEPEKYPVYLQERDHVAGVFDDIVLENEKLLVRVASDSGRIVSLQDKITGQELISERDSAGFTYIETETATSSAWNIGRHLKSVPVDRCIRVEEGQKGPLRQSVKAVYRVASSEIEVVYSLDRHQSAVKTEITVDWHESGSDIIPVLDYRVPLAYETNRFLYDVPAGALIREARQNDVPGLQYGMALGSPKRNAILISDSKYGYRGTDNLLSLTLINSSVNPDPYPERGIHPITLWLGSCEPDAKQAEEMATECNRKLFYQPSNSHPGVLPMESSLFAAEADHAVISAVVPSTDHTLLVRAYETAGEKGRVRLLFDEEVSDAKQVNLFEKERKGNVWATENQVEFEIEPFALAEVKVTLK